MGDAERYRVFLCTLFETRLSRTGLLSSASASSLLSVSLSGGKWERRYAAISPQRLLSRSPLSRAHASSSGIATAGAAAFFAFFAAFFFGFTSCTSFSAAAEPRGVLPRAREGVHKRSVQCKAEAEALNTKGDAAWTSLSARHAGHFCRGDLSGGKNAR